MDVKVGAEVTSAPRAQWTRDPAPTPESTHGHRRDYSRSPGLSQDSQQRSGALSQRNQGCHTEKLRGSCVLERPSSSCWQGSQCPCRRPGVPPLGPPLSTFIPFWCLDLKGWLPTSGGSCVTEARDRGYLESLHCPCRPAHRAVGKTGLHDHVLAD